MWTSIRLTAGAALLLAGTAFAAELESSVAFGVMRTDNLGQTQLDPEAQTIFQLIPAFSVTQESPRLTAAAALRIEGYRYDQREDSEVYNLFDGNMALAMVPEKFFLNAGVNRSQSLSDPTAAIPTGNFAFSGNRVERDEQYVGPSFRVGAGGDAVVSGDLRRTWVKYDEAFLGGLTELDYDNATIGVDNYRRARGFTWAVRYDYENTDYGELFAPFEYRQARVELGSWVGDTTRVFAAGGKESAWDQPLDPSLEDSFWEVGFNRQIGDRLSTEVAVGERSFGTAQRVRLDYTFARGSTGFTYSEDPATNSGDRFASGGLLLPDEPNDYLSRPDGVERYIQERLQWNLSIALNRISLSLQAFDENRSERARTDGAPLPDESQVGADLTVTWGLGPRTDIFIRGRTSTRSFVPEQDIDLDVATVGANYRLGARTSLSLTHESWRERAEDQVSGPNYRAKITTLLLTRTF